MDNIEEFPGKGRSKRGKSSNGEEKPARNGQAAPSPFCDVPGLKTGKHGPLKNIFNIQKILENTPEFRGSLAYDILRNDAVLLRETPAGGPCAVTDHTFYKVTTWLQERDLDVPLNLVKDGIAATAMERKFHPVQDYLSDLEWDGKVRIDQWLSTYTGAEDTPYTQSVGAKWLISAVARAMRPGCKADYMLVLEGEQGEGKSTTFTILGGDWYSDSLSPFGSKDASMEVTRWWIIEVAELNAMSRSEAAAIKAFITRQSERFRLPYGHVVSDVPRSCVFAGTLNPVDGYLKDPTGARRFWPVKTGGKDKVLISSLEKDRDQLWAEAFDRWKSREQWWLNAEIESHARAEQDERRDIDVWEKTIREHVEKKEAEAQLIGKQQEITMDDILRIPLNIEIGRWSHSDKVRVGNIMRTLGYRRYKGSSDDGTRPYYYEKRSVQGR